MNIDCAKYIKHGGIHWKWTQLLHASLVDPVSGPHGDQSHNTVVSSIGIDDSG